MSATLTRFLRKRLITLVDWKARGAQSMRISIRLCRASFVHFKGNYISDAVANLTREAYLVRTMLPGRQATRRKGHHKPILTIINCFYWQRSRRVSANFNIVFNLGQWQTNGILDCLFNGILDLYISLTVHTIYSVSRYLLEAYHRIIISDLFHFLLFVILYFPWISFNH